MRTKPPYQLFPVEDDSSPCYNDYGAKDVQDAAGKGVPILCHTTREREALDLFMALQPEVQCEMVDLLKFLSSAQPPTTVDPDLVDEIIV